MCEKKYVKIGFREHISVKISIFTRFPGYVRIVLTKPGGLKNGSAQGIFQKPKVQQNSMYRNGHTVLIFFQKYAGYVFVGVHFYFLFRKG